MKQKIDSSVSVNADLLYMWGAFPKNSDKPFILELDNPYTIILKRNKDQHIYLKLVKIML